MAYLAEYKKKLIFYKSVLGPTQHKGHLCKKPSSYLSYVPCQKSQSTFFIDIKYNFLFENYFIVLIIDYIIASRR